MTDREFRLRRSQIVDLFSIFDFRFPGDLVLKSEIGNRKSEIRGSLVSLQPSPFERLNVSTSKVESAMRWALGARRSVSPPPPSFQLFNVPTFQR